MRPGFLLGLVLIGVTVGGGPVSSQALPPAGYDYRTQVTACPPGRPCFEQTWFVRREACGAHMSGWRPEGIGRVTSGKCVKVR
jgi:hypothetical protein